jgi:hypothetical protein
LATAPAAAFIVGGIAIARACRPMIDQILRRADAMSTAIAIFAHEIRSFFI